MASCLGLYIEENIIKYAKVSKNHDQVKVESFGIKFYDKIGEAIDQVVEETYSQKSPISINLSEEAYNYFDMFALLTKQDLQKAIKTEFELYCSDKGYNPNAFETRYAISPKILDKEKLKVIHVSSNKIELNKRIQQLGGYKVTCVSPLPISLPNLIGPNSEGKGNALIVNLEEKTTITTILNHQIYDIRTLDVGSKEILDKINLKENSYSKSYELCKNTTIYTAEGRELQETDTSYLDDIMPTLYTITGEVKKVINDSIEEGKIENVYITGSIAMINNADLYFQEYLPEVKCQMLKPYFIDSTKDLSVKDYEEVNSAISLGLMGLDEGIQGMNFKEKSFSEKLPNWMKIEIGGSDKKNKDSKAATNMFINDLGQPLDKSEKGLLRVAIVLFLIFVIYSAFSIVLSNQMDSKSEQASQIITDTTAQIALANKDNEKLKTRTNEYTSMIENLESLNDKISDKNKTRNAIPNLLNQIMYIVPENVQITSIENTTGTHIVIQAQSNKYEQLGYLKAKIKSDVVLTNVISTAGEKENNVVTVTIEGDLP